MHKSILFDIEADNLLPKVTKVHCIALLDTDTGEEWSYGPDDFDKGLDDLYAAETIIGHNILGYDLPILRKIKSWNHRPGTRRIDTLVTARLLYPNLKREDALRKDFEGKFYGSHSLKAWGLRLGEPKANYEGPWDQWSQEMQSYMEQDVRTNYRLLRYLKPWDYPTVPLDLEHQVAEICFLMETEGWCFDQNLAQKLYVHLSKRKDKLETALVDKFGRWSEVDKIFVPKRDNKTRGYKAGVPVTKYKEVVFNPGSRLHIEKKLRELGWQPDEFTASGRAQLDEDILGKIDIPEATLIIEYLLVQKRLGQIGDGDNGWLRLVGSDGRIHGRINSGGTVTGRATHSNPNISQVPAVRATYGKECRSCFTVPPGWKLVGADMAGLELRTFSHYLATFDKGDYGRIVVEGDPHTHNQQLAGLPTRDDAKTFIYALIYGAGDNKIGKIIGKGANAGGILRQKFMETLPAYAKLQKAVEIGCRKNYLNGLDGRRLPIRSAHSALNTLLQSAGAVLCKQWLVDFYNKCLSEGLEWGYDKDFVIVGWIHDELQVACTADLTEEIGKYLVKCAEDAGRNFNFSIPLASSYVVGHNWADTH